MSPRRRHLVAAAIAAPFVNLLRAQERFPSRAISLICPWPPGGSSDAVVRPFGDSAARVLGVPVITENKPGVGGTLGGSAMQQAKPHGYALTQLPLGISGRQPAALCRLPRQLPDRRRPPLNAGAILNRTEIFGRTEARYLGDLPCVTG